MNSVHTLSGLHYFGMSSRVYDMCRERVDMDIIAFDSPWLIAGRVAGNSPQVDWGLRAGSVVIKASSRTTVSARIYASFCTLWRL